MASYLKGAVFNGYNGAHFWISLWQDTEQNKATAQSTVTLYLYAGSKDGYSGGGSSSPGYINGSQVGSISNIGVNSSNYIGKKVIANIQHDEYGEASLNYSASLNTNWDGVGSASLSGTLVLPKIDRYAIITEATNFNDEQNPTITFSNFELYDLKAKMYVENTQILSTNLADSTVTNYTFELTTAQRNQLRQLCTGKTLDVKLQIVSVENNVEKFASEATVVMNMINAEPTFTYTMIELNQNVIDVLGGSSASSLVDNVSSVKITVTPTTYKYATVAGVNVVAGGVTYSQTTSPYEITIPITDNTFTITVIDSRGYNPSQVDSNRTLIPYEPLRINAFTFKRESPISSDIILNAEIYFYDTIGSTVNTSYVKWKLDNGSYTTIPGNQYVVDSQNHKLTITNYELTNVLAYNLQGQFTLYVEDLLTSTQDSGDNGLVLKGVATYEAGEHDLQVNGDLIVADINRDNPVNVLDAIGEASQEVYSTTEQVIGKWVDGSALYRKTFTNVNWSSTASHFSMGITGLDEVINMYGMTSERPINFVVWFSNTPYYMATWISSNDIYTQCSSAYNNSTGSITIEYTKNS